MNLYQTRAAMRDWMLSATQKARPLVQDPESLHRPGAKSVIMLPGIWGRWNGTWLWAEALYDSGFDVHFVPEVDQQLGTLTHLADALVSAIQSKHLSRPIVVGHSKGGLVAKWAMREDPELLAGLIAVGTPFFGAPIARRMPPLTQLPDLAPETPQIRNLADYHEVNKKIVIIEAEWDQDVPTVGVLPGSLHCFVPIEGHNRLLEDPLTAERIVQFARHIDRCWD